MSTRVATTAFLILMLGIIEPASPAAAPLATPAGVPLDAPWKVRIYELAHARFLQATSFALAVRALRGFVAQIPPRLITRTARRIGAERAAELGSFLDRLQAESFGGRAM